MQQAINSDILEIDLPDEPECNSMSEQSKPSAQILLFDRIQLMMTAYVGLGFCLIALFSSKTYPWPGQYNWLSLGIILANVVVAADIFQNGRFSFPVRTFFSIFLLAMSVCWESKIGVTGESGWPLIHSFLGFWSISGLVLLLVQTAIFTPSHLAENTYKKRNLIMPVWTTESSHLARVFYLLFLLAVFFGSFQYLSSKYELTFEAMWVPLVFIGLTYLWVVTSNSRFDLAILFLVIVAPFILICEMQRYKQGLSMSGLIYNPPVLAALAWILIGGYVKHVATRIAPGFRQDQQILSV
jgi:hypothetical protein